MTRLTLLAVTWLSLISPGPAGAVDAPPACFEVMPEAGRFSFGRADGDRAGVRGARLGLDVDGQTLWSTDGAKTVRDDLSVPTRTHVRVERVNVDADTVLKASMSAQGGEAVRIVPE